MRKAPKSLTIAQKLASGGFLLFRREFCPWIGIGPVTAYKEVKAGRIKLTKIGRKSVVAAVDAVAYRDALRAASQSEAA